MVPFRSGRFSKQAHVDLPAGTFEEEHGRQGFFGRVSHLYRSHAPTGWTRINGSLLPRAYDLKQAIGDVTTLPKPFLGNADVVLAIYAPTQAMPHFARNADADECWFIHNGKGLVETDYGPLRYRQGDYVVIPRGTTYRFYPEGIGQFYLLIESMSELNIPDRGQLGRNAFFDPGCIEMPEAKPSTAPSTNGQGEWEVLVKHGGEFTSVFYPFNPLDVEGWKGDLFPWRLNVEDIRPIVSPRYHLPPSVHTTLVGQGFVLCTFAPRPAETEDPKALRVPFFHRNIEYDEVIFYHDGDFFSRSGIKPGMVTFHPTGIHHGPHPKALASQHTKEYLQEYAVMIDTYRPLKPMGIAPGVEIPGYKDSWKET
ncbi:MAG: homogentisate 1,2-dioxygenase, partial [Deltaproteobacteria bacterium]|nr:homogentisate 1,2-dioxygenase [Deltaproteobacteria bacterium]